MADTDLLDSQTLEKPPSRHWRASPSSSSSLYAPSRPLPPNPSLLALLLVIKTGTGPRVVLHYPPRPSCAVTHADVTVAGLPHGLAAEQDNGGGGGGDDDDDSDIYGGLSDEDNGEGFGTQTRSAASTRVTHFNDDDLASEAIELQPPKHVHDAKGFDSVFGYSVSRLARLMAPETRSWHQRRQELCMDGRVFVGCPVFRLDDGKWKRGATKSSKSRRHSRVNENSGSGGGGGGGGASSESEGEGESDAESSPRKKRPKGDSPVKDSGLSTSDSLGQGQGLLSTSTPSDYSAASSSASASLSMFNVVAVVAPPTLEYQVRVDDIYRNVVRALATILRRLQHKRNFVEHQTHVLETIVSNLRERGLSYDDAWPHISSISALARAFATTFDSVSASKVAHLSFKSARSVDSSIQIPHPLSMPFAPSLMSTHIPGLPLSSTSFTVSDPDAAIPTTAAISISPHAALLLLDESREALVRKLTTSSLTAGKNTSKAMAFLIRQISPRKTLLQFSRLHQIPLGHVQLLAVQLVRWRFARPISPLHATSTFIVSPNADWNELPETRQAFARRFPTLPDLMTVFSKLHGTSRHGVPVTWATLIPSSDHKDAYMDVLAWLMRGGWITELRTFAWIKIKSDVKRAVVDAIRRELEERERHVESEAAVDDLVHMEDIGLMSGFGTPERRPSSGEYASAAAHLRPHLQPPRPASEAGSTASSKTTIRLSAHLESLRLESQDRKSSTGSHEDLSDRASHPPRPGTSRRAKNWSLDPEELDLEPSLVLEPTRLSTVQQRWVKHLGESFHDERLRVAWPRLIKYFDGEHALEEIAVMEGWKRKVAAELLSGIVKEAGCLQIVRHW